MYGKRDYAYMDFDEMMDDEDEDPMGEGPGTNRGRRLRAPSAHTCSIVIDSFTFCSRLLDTLQRDATLSLSKFE